VETRGVDDALPDRQSTWRIAEQIDHLERRLWRAGIEDEHVGQATLRFFLGRGHQIRARTRGQNGVPLPAMRGADKYPWLARTVVSEHDVARLVPDMQRVADFSPASLQIQLDHAHAVGQVIDHPQARVPRLLTDDRDRDGPHAHLDGAAASEARTRARTQDLQIVIDRVGHDDRAGLAQHGHRSHGADLEQSIIAGGLGAGRGFGMGRVPIVALGGGELLFFRRCDTGVE
jgi:hypothetical protein